MVAVEDGDVADVEDRLRRFGMVRLAGRGLLHGGLRAVLHRPLGKRSVLGLDCFVSQILGHVGFLYHFCSYRLRSQMATEFIASRMIISTQMAPAARATNSWLGSCVQAKIWIGSAVNALSRPRG